MVTPLLRAPRTQGGTLYTFSSASRDLTRIFTNSNYSFKFSHFACLNLPDVYDTLFDTRESEPVQTVDRGLCFSNIGGYDMYNQVGGDGMATSAYTMNRALAEHIQNYVMNFETAILNGEGDNDDYNPDIIRTPSERIFFNWLQKVGAISFEEKSSGSATYYEEVYSNDDMTDRVIQYIGNIDTINSVDINGDAFDEVYLHIPNNVGASTSVKFNAITDDNYKYGNKVYKVSAGEKIIGRSTEGSQELSIYNLSVDAIYDDDTKNAYTGDNGYCIDFRDSQYASSDDDNRTGIMAMNGDSINNFEFNAVLIYYDFSDGNEVVTNLYGILILEEITDVSAAEDSGNNDNVPTRLGYIRRYPKYAETTGQNGNSFGLKVDIKIDALPDSSTVAQSYIDPNSTTSMQLFVDALTQLQYCTDIFCKQEADLASMETRIGALETLTSGMDTYNIINSRLTALNDRMDDMGITDEKTILELINLNTQRIQSLVNGKLTADLQYNTDVLKGGYGIELDKNNDGNLYIKSTNTSYNLNVFTSDKVVDDINIDNPFPVYSELNSTQNNVFTTLLEGTNLAILYVDSDKPECSNNLNIFIDDSNVGWKKGQAFNLMIKDYIDMSDYKLRIYTGFNGTTFTQAIEIAGEEVPYRPVIEFICIDEVMDSSYSAFIYELKSLDKSGESKSSNADADNTDGDYEPLTSEDIENIINED